MILFRKRMVRIVLAGLLLVFGLVAAFEPNRIIPGLLHGEAFYRYRPTRYWREILRADGAAGQIRPETVALFYHQWRAEGVLRECLKDADRNVRWPAARFISRPAFVAQVMPDLLAALNDSDLEVKLQILQGLRDCGPRAFAAVPRLAELLHDPEDIIAHFADVALWQIDPRRALRECGWKPYRSEKWGFSAEFPPEDDLTDQTRFTLTPGGLVLVHCWMVTYRGTAYAVAVSDYTDEQVKNIPPDEWFRRIKDNIGPMGMHVVEDQEIEMDGHQGWQHLSEADNGGLILSRLFWVGHRLYQVNATYMPQYASAGAVRHFLNSFHIEATMK